MARKKQKRKPTRVLDRLADMNWGGPRRMAVGVMWITGLAMISAGWLWGVPRLEAYASQQQFAESIDVVFLDPPAWMKGDLGLELSLTARSVLSGDPLAQHDLAAARQALLQTGWFDEVRQVRRVHAELVEIDAAFVDPYAVVRDRDGDHLIDPHGKLLPRSYPHDAAPQFVVIRGARYERPQRLGQPWEGVDITSALRLLRLFDREPWRGQVAAIDVSRMMREERMSVISTRGGRIVWGSPPGREQPLERIAEGKILLLDEQYKRSGLIDGGFDMLDLTLQEGSFRR